MNEKMKQKIESFENNQLGPEDEFIFSCDKCGKCCRNQEDLIMTPFDIFRMCKELKITPAEWMDLYGNIHIGDDSKLPIVRIKMIGESRRCPFLINNICSIQRIKPDICAIFPLGRGVQFSIDENDETDKTCGRVLYFNSLCKCGRGDKTVTVKDFIGSFGLNKREDYFIKWSVLVKDTVVFMANVEKSKMDYKDGIITVLYNMIIDLFYIRYDTRKPFEKQFDNNIKEWREIMDKFNKSGGDAYVKQE